ncbi:DUF808 domain-containing protein [Galbibacter mesophilus]|uniref:DUF808 domain-containing protein n=1 Tax=Galbibacter mesophilus TaxID=379069 RepID=UPI00191FFB22|nr:DUF808 domain-containing protein [Galbibacter mesophilus]MCM5662278.1 DUF808 domain-containing protein [Galbibacter mesophilus]
MASGILAILDDIATLMDDVAAMSKVAAKKTAGILGDDLAVNAEKASGFASAREIPVLWAISKGSLLNKVIILPVAFLLSAFLPVAITVILLLGGIYLAFEGAEKIYHYFVPHHDSKAEKIKEVQTKEEILAIEKERIKSAIITDFILSVEIVIIALGTVVEENIWTQVMVVTVIALIATVGVYGIVALIVRMDEAGLKLMAKSKSETSFLHKLGEFLVNALPKVIKGLTIIGTIALLLVSGGIFTHSIDYLHHIFPWMPGMIKDFLVGLIVGFLALLVFSGFSKVYKAIRK